MCTAQKIVSFRLILIFYYPVKIWAKSIEGEIIWRIKFFLITSTKRCKDVVSFATNKLRDD
jgi:hypothetical protein